MIMADKLMCHVVAGYPSAAGCVDLMTGMQAAGVRLIEVQIPFSDPIADGETIMRANDVALKNGMDTAGSFKLIKQAGLTCDVYIMSYVQKVRHFGFEAFCNKVSDCGVKGLIIPDLPYDSPEYNELSDYARALGLSLVPVMSPGMPEDRLDAILARTPSLVYVTSQRGITGNDYINTHELDRFVADIRKKSTVRIMIGFGISSRQDVQNALRLGDVAVVGSSVIREVEKSGVSGALKFVRKLIT